MILLYKYLYVHLYKAVSGVRRNAKYSALLYLSAISLFITFPFFLLAIAKFGKLPKLLFFLLSLLFAYLIYELTKRSIYNRRRFKESLQLFNRETKRQKITGYVIAVTVLIGSPVLFFFLMIWLTKLI